MQDAESYSPRDGPHGLRQNNLGTSTYYHTECTTTLVPTLLLLHSQPGQLWPKHAHRPTPCKQHDHKMQEEHTQNKQVSEEGRCQWPRSPTVPQQHGTDALWQAQKKTSHTPQPMTESYCQNQDNGCTSSQPLRPRTVRAQEDTPEEDPVEGECSRQEKSY